MFYFFKISVKYGFIYVVYIYTHIMLQNEIVVLNNNFISKNIVQFQMKLELSAKMRNYFTNNLTRQKEITSKSIFTWNIIRR